MAIKTQAELNQQNTTDIADNGTRKITASKVRSLFTNIIDTIFSIIVTSNLWEKVGSYIQMKQGVSQSRLSLKLPYLATNIDKTYQLIVDQNGVVKKQANAANYAYKGIITEAADFPLLAEVLSGDWYSIAADVTDDDDTRTNTGLTFETGEEIYWDGLTWQDYGSLNFEMSDDISEGITITKNEVIKGLNGVKTLIEEGEVLTIPEYYDYNTFTFNVDGVVELNGSINFL